MLRYLWMALLLTQVGCDLVEDQDPTSEAGVSGTDGTASDAGTGGTAGEAGSGGTAGEAGSGGTPGEAGSGGTPGEAGSGGASGGAGSAGMTGTPCEAVGGTCREGQTNPMSAAYGLLVQESSMLYSRRDMTTLTRTKCVMVRTPIVMWTVRRQLAVDCPQNVRQTACPR